MDSLEDKRILIVEDNVTNMAVYNVLLRKSGAMILQDFWSNDTINRLLRSLPVDVILMDLMLRHGTSGYDIFDRLKEHPTLSGIPVVAVSASDPEIEIPKARARGFAGFIGKPIDPLLFPQQVADCIVGKQVWYSQNGKLENFV